MHRRRVPLWADLTVLLALFVVVAMSIGVVVLAVIG